MENKQNKILEEVKECFAKDKKYAHKYRYRYGEEKNQQETKRVS